MNRRKPERRRWPGRAGQPQPKIPATAKEKVTRLDKAGKKSCSEFWRAGKLVGRAYWNPDGSPSWAAGFRNGLLSGHAFEYHDDGTIYVDPFVRGKLHGLAKQFDPRGRLLLVSPFKHGTGTDFWSDDQGRLAEEHPLVNGKPSGIERWWDDDQKSIYEETEWFEGHWHGATRRWTEGRLEAGFPKFFIRGKRVSRRAYLEAARHDPTLPPYRAQADLPARDLPKNFIALKERTLRLGRAKK